MALEKITTSEVQTLHVQAAPDNLIGTANQNKGVFDALPEKIVEKYNDTITKLTSNEEGSSGASQIVISAIQGLVGTTVQAALESLKAAQSGQATDISSCITSWTLDPTTGNITVTKFDGTSTVYETELEKVVKNFSYDQTTQSLILTYPDGTTTSISLASFIDEYDFEDSASIAFTVSGHKVTATLTSEYYNTLLGFKTAAEAAAANASTYAGNASASATAAAGSATAALNSEIAAKTSKELADADASAASGSATAAAAYAAQAAASATTAGTYAEESETSAGNAASSATAAASSATAASTSAANASTSASEASTSAGSAASSATAAQTSANNAASSANAASGSATNASNSATDAAGSASEASGSAQTSSEEALVSEGYANGTQNGEPVDPSSPYFHNNSKYWKEQAAAAASGQSKITAQGILKGLGDGNVVSALAGIDYAIPSQIPDTSTLAPLVSPSLTGTPTAPTAASGTNTTQIATTAFVQAAIAAQITAALNASY